jgi:phage baseplate assembly protein W
MVCQPFNHMLKKYYTLPLRFDKIISKEQHNNCSLEESIAQNLHLLVSTYHGESAFAEDYGCSIWDEEFRTHLDIKWKEEVRKSVMNAIQKFEPRLLLSDVKVELSDHESRNQKTNLQVRRKLVIAISGTIRKTNEKFNFNKVLFISPLSQV